VEVTLPNRQLRRPARRPVPLIVMCHFANLCVPFALIVLGSGVVADKGAIEVAAITRRVSIGGEIVTRRLNLTKRLNARSDSKSHSRDG
jgi:hypothetical protein